MSKQKQSRRNFLKTIGIGGGAAFAASALPGGFLNTANRNFTAKNFNMNSAAQSTNGDVELLCGDVVGFALESDQWEGDFGSVTFVIHEAWYNGEPAYYIRTDASEVNFAEENKLVYVPLLNAALVAEGATNAMYVFENGAEDQRPVISTVPTEENYTSAWHVHHVTFNGDPSLISSVDDLMAAESAGDVTIQAQQLVVNYPLVKWPGGELPEDTEKVTYLGTGPLISPVDTDKMLVTFKLHQCYPGSRYIVTDTSAVPMAPMMSIAPSGPTQALADVGATDEIWVFGNGIPGSGVMGFQPAVFDNAAGNPVWSPFWNHFTAVWKDEANAVVVTSSTQLRELIEAGELEIFNGVPDSHPNGFVVNCPVPIKARNTFEAM